MSVHPYDSPSTDPSPCIGVEDPIVVDSRREGLVAFGVWLAAGLWTIGYCAAFGYGQPGEVPLVLGVPSWVMWGVFAPWTMCTIVSSLLATFFIRDADLGEDPDDSVSEDSVSKDKRSEREAAREIGDA